MISITLSDILHQKNVATTSPLRIIPEYFGIFSSFPVSEFLNQTYKSIPITSSHSWNRAGFSDVMALNSPEKREESRKIYVGKQAYD